MPLSQNPIVEWPSELYHLLQGIQVTTDADGQCYGRIDTDVDRDTLFLLNDYEARVRSRQVRLRLTDSADECLVGEMNPLVGLGMAADPSRHISKVRISFHDIKDDSGFDPVPGT
jgi:hypothetical protein